MGWAFNDYQQRQTEGGKMNYTLQTSIPPILAILYVLGVGVLAGFGFTYMWLDLKIRMFKASIKPKADDVLREFIEEGGFDDSYQIALFKDLKENIVYELTDDNGCT